MRMILITVSVKVVTRGEQTHRNLWRTSHYVKDFA